MQPTLPGAPRGSLQPCAPSSCLGWRQPELGARAHQGHWQLLSFGYNQHMPEIPSRTRAHAAEAPLTLCHPRPGHDPLPLLLCRRAHHSHRIAPCLRPKEVLQRPRGAVECCCPAGHGGSQRASKGLFVNLAAGVLLAAWVPQQEYQDTTHVARQVRML